MVGHKRATWTEKAALVLSVVLSSVGHGNPTIIRAAFSVHGKGEPEGFPDLEKVLTSLVKAKHPTSYPAHGQVYC